MIRVETVAAEVTFALRTRVLRPHERVDDMALPGDDDPDSAHLVVRDGAGAVIGTATVRRESPPWDPAAAGWRLRGMAVAEGHRRRGVGGALLAAVVDHVAASGGGLLWCNARLPAVAFYRRAGLVSRGDAWDEPHIGPHVVMTRVVAAADRT